MQTDSKESKEDHSLQVWPSGRALALYIIRHPEIFKRKIVLDLGTGIGICGIAALQTNCSLVYLCDLAFVLDRINLSDSRLVWVPWNWFVCGDDEVPQYVRDAPPDVIVASDIFYNELDVDDVLASIYTFLKLKKGAFALVSVHRRSGDFSLELWLKKWNLSAEWVSGDFDEIEEVEEIDSIVLLKIRILD
jgi:predicted nicotinamide N-methyase